MQRTASGSMANSFSSSSPSSQPLFLKVSVSEPVKLGTGVQAYVSYRVISKTNFPHYSWQEKIVIRRYSDFEWLHEKLSEKYKGIFIPPLPEKNAVEKFRFSAEFIELRRRALDLFVNRVASHVQLQQSDDLKTFLQEDEETMERIRLVEASIFSTKPASWMQMFKDVQSKMTDAVLGKEKPIEESGPEYERLKQYITDLEGHLTEVQRQAVRLVKRHRELAQSLSDFGKAVKLLGACEGEQLGKALSDIGSKSEMLSFKLQKEADRVLLNFEEPLKDYLRAVLSIKVTMADRASAFRQCAELAEAIKLKEHSLERLILLRSDRVPEVENECREMREETEEAKRRFETIAKLMKEEMVRFQEEKTLDIGFAFHQFAEGQAKLAGDIASAWRGLLPKLEQYQSSRW